jgi:hypothetical protein
MQFPYQQIEHSQKVHGWQSHQWTTEGPAAKLDKDHGGKTPAGQLAEIVVVNKHA